MKEYRIYKYELKTTDRQAITLPRNAEILSVQSQFGILCLWARVDFEQKDTEERHIEVFATGQAINHDMGVDRKYLGTYQLNRGSFVGHVFERIS